MSKKDVFKIDFDIKDLDLETVFDPFDPLQDADPDLPELPASNEPSDPIDWPYLEFLSGEFLQNVAHHYFRTKIIGVEKISRDGPLILAPNHSGTSFPYDAIIMDSLLWSHYDYEKRLKFRSVFSPKLTAVWWMRPFGIDNWWRRAGGVDMTFTNYDQLLERGDRVIYYPEGIAGIGKGFLKRYQLQHFYSSFIVLAARHNAPIHPVSIVNAEWVNPTGLTFKPVDKFFDKFLGIPFFPIPIMLIVLLFPFFFYFAFPCKMRIIIGDPINVRDLMIEEGYTDLTNPDRATAKRIAARIQKIAQKQLTEGVVAYGDKPYDFPSLFASLKQNKGRIFRTLPFGWAWVLKRHERDKLRPPAKNRFHALLRDLDLLAFYIPFGWFLLVAFRKLRKPPYGYRGLSEQERRKQEGSYRWSLLTHPLPEREPPQDTERQHA